MSNNKDRELCFRWLENPDRIGEMLFTFDGEKVFNLFRDYPHELNDEELRLFDEANPYWADFFKDRRRTQDDG